MMPFLTRIIFEHFAFGLLIPVYIIFLIEQLGLSLTQVGLAVSTATAATFILEVPTGILADRVKRKYLLLASSVLHCAAYTALFFATDIHLVLLGAIFTGAGFAFASGAEESYVHDTFENSGVSFEKQLSKVSISDEAATILGMLSSSLILTYFNYSTLISLAIFSLGVAVFASLLLMDNESVHSIAIKENVETKIKFTFKKGAVLLIVAFLLLSILTESGRLLWQPQLIASGWSGIQLGYIFAIIKLGSLAGAYIAGTVKMKNLHAVLLGGFVGAVGLVIFSVNLFIINLCGLALFLLAENFVRIHATSFILSLPNVQKQKATTLSIFSIVNNSYLSMSGVVLGVMASLSLSGALVAVAIVKVVATLFLGLYVLILKRHYWGQLSPMSPQIHSK